MILADGALSDYSEAFTNATINSNMQGEFNNTRVFTYLIGKDLKNSEPLKEIACKRKGYFMHIASPAGKFSI
jgi:hypothetical protein